MESFQNNPWFVSLNKPNIVRSRLFCFHHSGGTASFFRSWIKYLPSEVELIAIQLPGREERSSEAFITDMDTVVRQLVDGFREHQTDIPFVFFGHSLGSLIAFEVINELQRCSLNLPNYFIISGRKSPQTPPKEKIHSLPDDLLIKGLMKYQGIPPEVLQNKELLRVLLPRLRADFTLTETYLYKKKNPIICPVLILGGKDDLAVTYDELANWKQYASKDCTIKLFSGGHFFINTYKKEVLTIVCLIISNIIEKSY